MTKGINQHYFNRESKAMYYVLGAFYHSLTFIHQNISREGTEYSYQGIKFNCSSMELVEIVQRELKSQHKILSYGRANNSSYFFQVYGVPTLCERINELGLSESKEDRKFPDMGEKYLSHFCRGFFDASRTVYGHRRLEIRFNSAFVSGLRKVLGRYAHVEGGGTKEDTLQYSGPDFKKLHDFLYQDWGYIRRKGIYLPHKKNSLDYTPKPHNTLPIKRAELKVENAKKIWKRDPSLKVKQVAEMVGYLNPLSLCQSFKRITGMTTTEYRNNAGKKEKDENPVCKNL